MATDPNGHWIFVDLPRDKYVLYFSKEGYEFYVYTNSSQELIGPIDSITVYDDVTDLAVLAVSISDDFLAGEGTRESPYLIQSPEDLLKVNDKLEAHYKLVADIDLDPNSSGGQVFDRAIIAPDMRDPCDPNVAYEGTPFVGTFDGNGFAIRNLTMVGHSYLGVFGSVAKGAQVRNLHVVDANVVGTEGKIGSLVGHNLGLIVNCSGAGGEICGSVYVGGLVGINESLSLVSCSFSSNAVIGEYAVGGLVGANLGIASNSYSKGTVDGLSDVGGLIGDNLYLVIHCYSCGRIDGNYEVGGLVGSNSAYVLSSFWDIETSGQFISEGGTGLTTVLMYDINTYINAGWDFIGNTQDNTRDIWWILEGQDYPRLWWEAK